MRTGCYRVRGFTLAHGINRLGRRFILKLSGLIQAGNTKPQTAR